MAGFLFNEREIVGYEAKNDQDEFPGWLNETFYRLSMKFSQDNPQYAHLLENWENNPGYQKIEHENIPLINGKIGFCYREMTAYGVREVNIYTRADYTYADTSEVYRVITVGEVGGQRLGLIFYQIFSELAPNVCEFDPKYDPLFN